jgi:tetratricopeptide (TPR) repeat protein
MRIAITKWLTVLAFVLAVAPASAQTTERDMEKEKAIWQQLGSIAPKSVEDFKAATAAFDKDDYQEAARLYAKVLEKAPDFDAAQRRRGGALVQMGRAQEGLMLLEKAVQQKRSRENLLSLAQCLAYPGEGKDGTVSQKGGAGRPHRGAQLRGTGI